MKLLRYTVLAFFIVLFLPSCKKTGFLNTRPNDALVVPSSISDCQALLDDDVVMNGYGSGGYPAMLENGSDDFYCTDAQYKGYSTDDQNAVIWAPSIFTDTSVNDWDLPYRTVLYANLVLGTLSGIHPSSAQQPDWNQARGAALFFRAFAFYQLAQVFSPAYDSTTAAQTAGIPLRLTSDPQETITRASLEKTYQQITKDLLAAIPLLSNNSSDYPTRPNKAAAFAMLARACLVRQQYYQALPYIDSCLQRRNSLMQYDTVTESDYFSFTRNNPEVIFAAAYRATGPSRIFRALTDSILFNAYADNDLRKKLFFKGGSYFFGQYDETGYAFCGIATDECYLIRAECLARTGNATAAMQDLNTLLRTRCTGYIDQTNNNRDSTLSLILLERRKELLFRGLRWTDLKRLNQENRWATTLKRTVANQDYTLPPNDPRYVYPIPANILTFNPGMTQNPR